MRFSGEWLCRWDILGAVNSSEQIDRLKWDGLPTDQLLAVTFSAGQSMGVWASGAVLMGNERHDHRLIALLVGDHPLQPSNHTRLLRYMHLGPYTHTLCTFLNLGCQPTGEGVTLLENRVLFFDRFLVLVIKWIVINYLNVNE